MTFVRKYNILILFYLEQKILYYLLFAYKSKKKVSWFAWAKTAIKRVH